VLPLLGGLICDKIGIRVALILFDLLVVTGSCIFAIGCNKDNVNFTTMLIGRFIFGLGSETQFVCKTAIIAHWFRGREMGFAFGVGLTAARLGSVFAGIIEPNVADARGVEAAAWVGCGFCVFSFLNAMGMVCVDKKVEENDR